MPPRAEGQEPQGNIFERVLDQENVGIEQLRLQWQFMRQAQNWNNLGEAYYPAIGGINGLGQARINPRVEKIVTPSTPEEEAAMPLVNTFLVGCDPEFVALGDRGEILNTANFGLRHEGQVGHDHGGDVIEVRPEPAKGTYTLLKRIKALIDDERLSKIPAKKFRAGAMVRAGEPVPDVMPDPHAEPGQYLAWARRQGLVRRRQSVTLGGHIHLDLNPYKAAGPAEGELDPFLQVSDAHNLRIKALDHLTHRLEALDILPRRESEARRQDGMGAGYGKYGDCRFDYGGAGKYRTEYRTMASWLYHPVTAFLCLTAGKLAAAKPQFALDNLGRFHDFKPFARWFEAFASEDINARRLCENVLSKGLSACQHDPDVNLRESWAELGV